MKKNIIYLFAHQDDEFGVFSDIYRNKEENNIYIFYLTNGTSSSIKKNYLSIRDRESIKVLTKLGIKKKNITQLNNVEIPRDVLLDKKIIEKCFNMISDLKKKYSSNIFTCLHQNSNEKQR